MKNQFCKVFDVQGHQVLYRTGTDDEGDDAIIVTTLIDGLFMSTTISGFEKNDTSADEQFKTIGQANAENFFNSMLELTK